MKRLLVLALCSLACATAPSAPSGAPVPSAETAPAPVEPWTRAPVPPPLPAITRHEDQRATYQLANGLRVLVVQHGQRPVVSVRLVLPTGATVDPDRTAGATFLAYALLGERYEINREGKRIVDEKTLTRQFAELGAQLDVSVRPDVGVLAVDGYARDLRRYLEKLAEAVRRPRLGELTFAGYRDALLDRVEDAEVGDDAMFFELLSETAFGRGHPYARPAVGTAKSLGEVALEDVRVAQARALGPKGAVLVVVGRVEARDVFGAADVAFGAWSSTRASPPPAIKPPAVQPRRAVRHVLRAPSATLFACAARPLSDVRASLGELELLAELLAVGAESRMNRVVREAEGLTYGASARLILRRGASAFVVCARLKGDESQRGMQVFLAALDSLRASPVSTEDLGRARATLLGRLDQVSDDLGRTTEAELDALITGVDIADRRALIRRVTPASLQPVLEKVLDRAKLQLIVAGEAQPARAAVQGNGLGPLEPMRLDGR